LWEQWTVCCVAELSELCEHVWRNEEIIGRINGILEFKVAGIKIDAPDIPEIPKLAAGGIVNAPTLAMIGEAGPEAVVPLTGNNVPNMGGNSVTINVNGGDPNAVVDALRRYMKTNGNVAIKVTG